MRIRDIFFRNFWWKLASVALATLIWINYVYPRRSQLVWKPSRQLDLTVVLVANTADVRQFKTDPAVVTVRLEGEDNELKHVNQADIHARAFVPDEVRTNGAILKVEVSGLPPGVSVLTIVPDKVTIQTPPVL